MSITRTSRAAALASWLGVCGLAATACGHGTTGGQTSPSSVAAAVITITATGANPKSVVVSPGSQVTFVNADTVEHQMYSDPHPEHTDCPELDSVGYLAPGQSRQSGNLNVVRTCGFHDHIHFDNDALKGSIVIR
jgi:plastocyanin